MYKITERTKQIAKKNNLTINTSNDGKHKIDVFKKSKFIASIGGIGYNDYPTYLELEKDLIKPKGYADSRKKLYKIRHKDDLKTTKGKLANLLLWT